MGLGHRAHDPARAGTAGTDEDLDREHAVVEPGPRPPSWRARAGVLARVGRCGRDDRRSPAGARGQQAVVRQQRPPWRGHKGGEPLQQLQRVHQERRRAVAPDSLRRIGPARASPRPHRTTPKSWTPRIPPRAVLDTLRADGAGLGSRAERTHRRENGCGGNSTRRSGGPTPRGRHSAAPGARDRPKAQAQSRAPHAARAHPLRKRARRARADGAGTLPTAASHRAGRTRWSRSPAPPPTRA